MKNQTHSSEHEALWKGKSSQAAMAALFEFEMKIKKIVQKLASPMA